MSITSLKDKLASQYENISDIQSMFEELEATYQQLVAMSEQLDQSEEKYALLIQNMSDVVWISDTSGKITYINEIVSEVLGYRRDEMIGEKLYHFMCPLHEYDRGSCKEMIAGMNNLNYEKQELWMLHKDQKTRKVLEVNTKRVYFDGVLLEIQGVGRDITERIQSERKIRKKNRQFDTLNIISSSITTNLSLNNLDKLLKDICKSVVHATQIPMCSIRLIDEHGNLCIRAIEGKEIDLVNKSPIMGIDAITQNAFETGMPIMITVADVQPDHVHFGYLHEHLQIKSIHIFPLIANGKPLGTLMLGTDVNYDDENVLMLTPISNNIAFAIEKSNLYKNLKEYYFKIITTLVAAMEAKDTYTQGHSLRVSKIAVEIARTLQMSSTEIEELQIAAILHDIGKIGINDSILTKPGSLEKEEYEQIKMHPLIGMKILEAIELSDNIQNAILYHHLRYDLKGYPETDEISELPMLARIIGVADSIDAMNSNRSYKAKMSLKEIESELKRHSGSQFCPKVIEVVLTLLSKFVD